jgi:xylulokinase
VAKKIIAYDLRTGGAKASLYDEDGTCLAGTFVYFGTSYPHAGWPEQRPEQWWRAVVESTRRLLDGRRGEAGDIGALAISGQNLGAIPVDREGNLLRKATPIWSDTRAARQASAFFERVDAARWYMTTGNGFPAECYSVFKIMWYRDHEPQMFSRIHRVIGSKDYLNFMLTGRIVTDFSYASGSGVYDLLGWSYSPELIRASGLPAEIFPPIVPSTQIIGTLTRQAARELGLPESVPVACGGVDNSCMALGARNTGEGRVYTSLGSSSWIAVSSKRPVLDPRFKPYVFAHVIPGLFTSAVSIFAGGSSLRWIRDILFGPDAERVLGRDPYEVMNEMAAASPVGGRPVLLAAGADSLPQGLLNGPLQHLLDRLFGDHLTVLPAH